MKERREGGPRALTARIGKSAGVSQVGFNRCVIGRGLLAGSILEIDHGRCRLRSADNVLTVRRLAGADSKKNTEWSV